MAGPGSLRWLVQLKNGPERLVQPLLLQAAGADQVRVELWLES